jgi:hypothetical protein
MKQVATYLNFDDNCRKAMQFYQKCLDTDIDHIDLRVPRLAEVVAFYEALLPALGFSGRMAIEGWSQFQAAGNMSLPRFHRKQHSFPGGESGGRGQGCGNLGPCGRA